MEVRTSKNADGDGEVKADLGSPDSYPSGADDAVMPWDVAEDAGVLTPEQAQGYRDRFAAQSE